MNAPKLTVELGYTCPRGRENTKNATQILDCTTITDTLRTVSWGNDSHQTGVVKPVHGFPTFPLTTKAV